MTRHQLEYILPVMQQYINGRTVQRSILTRNDWVDDNNPTFGVEYDWRIKPEKKLIPFTFGDINMFKDRWISLRTSTHLFRINSIGRNGISISGIHRTQIISYSELFENYMFDDGSNCGKYAEE